MCVCIYIYKYFIIHNHRIDKISAGNITSLPYVYTNPWAHTVLNEGDKLFVLCSHDDEVPAILDFPYKGALSLPSPSGKEDKK